MGGRTIIVGTSSTIECAHSALIQHGASGEGTSVSFRVDQDADEASLLESLHHVQAPAAVVVETEAKITKKGAKRGYARVWLYGLVLPAPPTSASTVAQVPAAANC